MRHPIATDLGTVSLLGLFALAATGAIARAGDAPHPVPSRSAQKDARAKVRETLRADYAASTPEAVRALCEKLLATALETDEPVFEFVLLEDAIEIASRSGQPDVAFQAIDALERNFEIDGEDARGDALKTLSKSRSPGTHRSLAEVCLDRSEAFAGADDYGQAERWLKQASTSARKSGDVILTSRVEERGAAIAAMAKAHRRVSSALEKLRSDPEDARANQKVGEFRCLFKGDWETGLPLLAKASDEELAALAKDDLGASDPAATGDAWWDYALSDDENAGYRARALHWYEAAWPDAKGLAKERIRARFREASARRGGPKEGPAAAKGWILKDGMTLDPGRARSGLLSVRLAGSAAGSSFYNRPMPESAGGRKYRLSAWVLCDQADEKASLEVRFYDEDGEHVVDNIELPRDEPWWHRVEKVVTAPDGTRTSEVLCWPYHRTGNVWIDDVSLVDLTTGEELVQNSSFEQAGR